MTAQTKKELAKNQNKRQKPTNKTDHDSILRYYRYDKKPRLVKMVKFALES